MLGSIKLVFHVDGDGANLVDSMDLLNFAQGFEMSEDGWIPQQATGAETTLTETLTFRVKAVSQNALADRLHVLDDWITRVDYYRSQSMRTAVWLRVQYDNETEPRQALVSALSYQVGSSPFEAMWQYNNFVSSFVIVIERGAFWEEITSQTDSASLDDHSLDQLTNIITGDVSARVMSAAFTLETAAQNTTYIGFKNDRFYNPINFYPTRALHAFAAGAGTDVTFEADTDTWTGQRAKCTFATTTLVQRFSLPMEYYETTAPVIVQLADDYVSGEYIVLLRARCTSTAIARARLKMGYRTSVDSLKIYPRVSIGVTSYYKLYEMGRISIPFQRLNSSAPPTYAPLSTALKLDAELVSGSGNLYMDCFILIPTDGMIKSYTDVGMGALGGSGVIQSDALLNKYGVVVTASAIKDTLDLSSLDWSLPQSVNGIAPIVVAASESDTTGSENQQNIGVGLSYIRRWRTLRGNE